MKGSERQENGVKLAMRDKKRREEIKNVDKREKVRLFTKRKGKPERWKRG